MKWHGYLDQTDYWVVLSVILLSLFGLSIIYSVTFNDPSTSIFFYRQLTWIILGLLMLIFITGYDYHFFLRYAYSLYILNILLLVFVMYFGIRAGGATRWISIAGIQFQPSELTKIILILTLTRYLTDSNDRIWKWQVVLGAFVLIGIPMILIMKQPHLGTALVLIPILYALLFIAQANIKHLAAPIAVAILLSPLAFAFLKTYQKARLFTFLDPHRDPLGAGYQVIQSQIAIGSGQLTGKGWLEGTQTQLDFLPANHTDFAFSAFAEQFGFIGALIILGLFAFILIRMFLWASAAKDKQGAYIIIGVATLLLSHLLINIGMSVGMMPITGLPLPLISYGGTSHLTFMIAIGLAINVHQRRHTW